MRYSIVALVTSTICLSMVVAAPVRPNTFAELHSSSPVARIGEPKGSVEGHGRSLNDVVKDSLDKRGSLSGSIDKHMIESTNDSSASLSSSSVADETRREHRLEKTKSSKTRYSPYQSQQQGGKTNLGNAISTAARRNLTLSKLDKMKLDDKVPVKNNKNPFDLTSSPSNLNHVQSLSGSKHIETPDIDADMEGPNN